VGEIPIRFEDRRYGESKLTLREQLRYLQHLRRLGLYRFGARPPLARFLAIGALGALVNLVVLTALLHLGFTVPVALAGGIGISMFSNLTMTGRSSAYGAAGIGAVVNLATSLGVVQLVPRLPVQVAGLFGIAAGALINLAAHRFRLFREQHVRP
jgi:dolichol-phosphate mannosyltransferase